MAGSQPSVVQTLPSSQLGGGPPTHSPPLQVSFVVHSLPSLHGSLLFTKVQPVAGLQPSSVQPLLSLQPTGSLTHLWSTHRSFVVHWSVSPHWLSKLQQSSIPSCVQPPCTAGSQASVVHALPSSQLGAEPPTHDPPLQVSFVVHSLPSLHGAALFVWVQPPGVEGLQASSVQTLPSSQLGGGPPAHDPPLQVSPVVHSLPSLHGSLLFTCTQPPGVEGLQSSSVQPLLSLQLGGAPPTHEPPLQ